MLSCNLATLLQKLKEEFHSRSSRKGWSRKSSRMSKSWPQTLLQLLLVLVGVLLLQHNQGLQQLLIMVVDDQVFGVGRDVQCLGQIGLAAVRKI